MALTTGTISSVLTFPDGVTPLLLEVTIRAVADRGVVKAPGEGLTLAAAQSWQSTENGTLTVPNLPLLPQAGILPPEARWRADFRFLYSQPNATPLPSIEFEHTGATGWDDLIDVSGVSATQTLLDAIIVARDATLAAAAAAEVSRLAAEAVPTTTDGLIASRVNDNASASLAAMVARFPRRGELTLNVADYGVVGDTTVQDMTALNAAITSAVVFGGVSVYFPRQAAAGQYYNLTQSFPNVNNVRIYGDNMGTILRWTDGNMLNLTGVRQRWSFEDIGLENSATAGHMIEGGSVGSLIHSVFRRCEIKPRALTTSFLHIDNASGNTFGLRFRDCQLWRFLGQTVPFLDIRTDTGGLSSLSVDGGQWHSQLCNSSPFVRVEATGLSYAAGYTFLDIVGEQNLGGMIHIYGPSRLKIENVVDFDTGPEVYADDIFKADVTVSGLSPQGVVIDNSGTNAITSFAAGKGHLRITGTGTGHEVGRIVNGGASQGVMFIPDLGRRVRHGGGSASSVRSIGSSLALSAADSTVICSSGTPTFTLPDPTAVLSGGTFPVGREFTVKNVSTNALTVISAGVATIDGAASVTVRQFESARLMSDGINWHVLALSRPQISDQQGTGDPEASVTAGQGATYRRTAGAAGTPRLYVKVSGTGNTGWRPARPLTATATLNFPSITASGGTSDLTIAVTGAAVGDPVHVGRPAAFNAGVILEGFVSAVDVVTVRATNVTAAAIDPAAGSFAVAVTKPA